MLEFYIKFKKELFMKYFYRKINDKTVKLNVGPTPKDLSVNFCDLHNKIMYVLNKFSLINVSNLHF